MAPWSERRLIEKIRGASSRGGAGLLKSIGDDCCEVSAPGSFLISTDSLVEGIHFDCSFHPPHLLGRKSIAVNLSDIAAMGGKPRFVLLALCLPEDLEWDWISSWLDGVFEILGEFDCILIGGDTVKSKELVITVTVLGEPVPGGVVLYRDTAQPGDGVWISGSLGAAGCGLKLLLHEQQRAGELNLAPWDRLIAAHLNPVPRIALGQRLARSGMVSAMQDVSDGLATDLAHICQASGVSALLWGASLPCLPELVAAAAALQLNVEDLILRSGEDYELVFTVKQGQGVDFVKEFAKGDVPVVRIGEIAAGEGVFLKSAGSDLKEEISFQGYQH